MYSFLAFVSWVAVEHYQELLQSEPLLIYHASGSSQKQKIYLFSALYEKPAVYVTCKKFIDEAQGVYS